MNIDLQAAKENVSKRLEFIEGELIKVDNAMGNNDDHADKIIYIDACNLLRFSLTSYFMYVSIFSAIEKKTKEQEGARDEIIELQKKMQGTKNLNCDLILCNAMSFTI